MKTMYFPMDVLRVTQGYGIAHGGVKANTYSHAGSYALDLGGADTGADWLYAPCDMVVRRVYGVYNAVWFESLEPLESVGSTVIMMCLHMNDADRDALGIKAGKVFRTGEKCYREGMSGNVTGTHVHIELGRGPMTGTGWKQNAQGVWVINDPLIPSELLTLREDCSVMNDGGYAWKTERTARPLSDEPVRMQCTASAGDQKMLGAAMEGLGIAYKVDGLVMATDIAVSAGDQRTLVAAAAPLGIEWSVLQEAAPDESNALEAAVKRAEKAEAENEELRAAITEAESKAKNEAERAARAEEQSAAFLRMIEAARAALGV